MSEMSKLQAAQILVPKVTAIDTTPESSSRTEHAATNELWQSATRQALEKLPAKDVMWLFDEKNQRPLTSTQLIDLIRVKQDTYSNRERQRLFAKLDPIISHLRSFTKVIAIFSQADPTCSGLIWGGIYLTLQLACQHQKDLETMINLLTDISSHLSLFSRWQKLFPQKPYFEVSESIKIAYGEVINFYADALRYLRHSPVTNLLRTIVKPIEHKLVRHENAIRRCISRVREEVDTANMEHIHKELAALPTAINASPTPRLIDLPTIRIIPHSRNHRFFGRKEILQSMHGTFLSGNSPRQKRFALTGPGGSGKTQIALEYSYSKMEDFRSIIWILADSAAKINQSFEDAAEQLGMPKGTQSAKQVRRYVLNRLSGTSEKYLLCFDNADDLSLIRDCFPPSNNGYFVITTRDSGAAQDFAAKTLIVPEFSLQEGCEFLRSVLPSQICANHDSSTLLGDICEIFHGYPVALAQIAGFIKSGGFSLRQFIQKLQDSESAVDTAAIAAMPLADYHANLNAVWTMSFTSLGPRSQQVLEMLVYLDPDSVAIEILREGCVRRYRSGPDLDLEYMADPTALRDALDGLRAQSLIRTNPDSETISIHRFFQDRAFQHLLKNKQRRRRAFQEALFLLQTMQPKFPNVTQHWSPDLFRASELCLTHIKQLAVKFQEATDVFDGFENELGGLISESASYQFEKFHHHAATEMFQLARDIIGRSADPNELILSDCRRMEGRMFNESGRPVMAMDSNLEAERLAKVATKKGLILPNDQRIPRILTGLGNSLSQLERYDEALAAQLEAKKLCGDVPPEQSDAITIIQLNFGFLMYRRGDLETAKSILCNTLEASPRTPPALYALGNTLLAQGKTDEALATHLKGLEIYITMFGDQHALVGRAAYKVGEILLLYQNDVLTARMYLRKALSIYHKQESPYYTEKAYARAARMLAKSFHAEGLKEDADYYYHQAWELRRRIDGVKGSMADEDRDYWSCLFYWDQ